MRRFLLRRTALAIATDVGACPCGQTRAEGPFLRAIPGGQAFYCSTCHERVTLGARPAFAPEWYR